MTHSNPSSLFPRLFGRFKYANLKTFYDPHENVKCIVTFLFQVDILELLAQQGEDHWLPWQQKRPLLHIACERGAWNCVKYLVSERTDEINQCYDEYYPIHQAALHDIKFLELLIQCGAETTVRTSTQQMTALHVVLLEGKKTAEDTLQTAKLLMEHGLRELINEADSLGNTPLHVLIVRYALEERRFGYSLDHQPWNKWDMLHIVRYLLQNGARPSINQSRNSALACVLRHITDWEFRYDLLHMLLQEGGDPNVEGRDGSVPLMVCLVPLINKDPLHHFTHTMKVCYLNCVRILCEFGANPNCSSRSNLTPLHVLVFTASENISLAREREKEQGFEFIRNLLTLLLQHGLNPNVRFSQRFNHILLSLMDMVQNARVASDLNYVYDLTLTLIQYGADPNVRMGRIRGKDSNKSSDEGEESDGGYYAYGSYEAQRPSYMGGHHEASTRRSKNPQVLYHFIQILMNKDFLCHDPDQVFGRIVSLYHLSMSHRELYGCLKILYAQTGMNPNMSALCSVIREKHSKPRTLKQMARIVIYNAIDQKPALNASKLPLPPTLRNYIMNFEP